MEDNSTIVYEGGIQEWYSEDGQLHREDGPACIHRDGYEEWWLNNKLHREDGPARTWPNGSREWFKNGLLHRLDGPAVIHPNGFYGWWLKGKEYSFNEWINLAPLNNKEKILLILKYR